VEKSLYGYVEKNLCSDRPDLLDACNDLAGVLEGGVTADEEDDLDQSFAMTIDALTGGS